MPQRLDAVYEETDELESAQLAARVEHQVCPGAVGGERQGQSVEIATAGAARVVMADLRIFEVELLVLEL